jgi:hypothetical protein
MNNDITSSNSGCVAYQMRLPPFPMDDRPKGIPPPHPSSILSISHIVEPILAYQLSGSVTTLL